MQNWKNKSIIHTYFIATSCTVVLSLIGAYIYMMGAWESKNVVADLMLFIMTIISVLIAIFAYHISVKTYVSIDAVNAISRMDGNVMENVNYRTGILTLISTFKGEQRDEVAKAFIAYFKESFGDVPDYSGAKLADKVQEVIDSMVLISFLIKPENGKDLGVQSDNLNRVYVNELNAILKNMEKRVAHLEEMSEGSCILVKESVKLIKAVFAYQLYKADFGDVNKVSLLMDVRGAMLQNAISRTIYYNYIGLFYLNKALLSANRMGESRNPDLYAIENLRRLSHREQGADYNLAVLYLDEAIGSFDKAVASIEDEIMWNAFIQYNKARAEFLKQRILNEGSGQWKQTMNTAIAYRIKLNLVLDDMLTGAPLYFQRAFRDQERLAKLMKIRFEMVAGDDLTNEIGEVIVAKTAYAEVKNLETMQFDQDEFLRLEHIRADIFGALGIRS